MVKVIERLQAYIDSISLLSPMEIDKDKLRIGPNKDGGYVFAGELDPSQSVLSFGIDGNCDMEFQLAQQGHEIFMFDPTIEHPPLDHSLFRFHKIGVAGEKSSDGVFVGIEDALAICKLDNRSNLLLKMDVEGAEFDAINLATRNTLLKFEQIVFEVHWLHRIIDVNFRSLFDRVFRKLNEDFVLFHVHANNCGQLMYLGAIESRELGKTGGIPLADVMELSYVRKDLVKYGLNRTFYPTHMDYANDASRPDYMMWFFPFLPMP